MVRSADGHVLCDDASCVCRSDLAAGVADDGSWLDVPALQKIDKRLHGQEFLTVSPQHTDSFRLRVAPECPMLGLAVPMNRGC
jgi:hypothetical protein